MEITVKTAEQLRLTKEEFELIKQKLGRTPNFNELCAFSAMWSEHCSYKNSIKWLKTLPREGGRMLVAAGEENAGLMDIGDGLGVVFKIESHNHPSALEPFQGAATGMGGIHRDIFTMGARPIAALNSLRFGKLNEARTQHLLAGVVHGIGHYGNCFGVPTVGGEIYFDPCYHTNPLVNAMSVGIVKAGETVSATAEGTGNPVIFVGSATGKDGIGGASFASADITSESVQELPAVQVGDPFQEKKLLEACLEVIRTGAVVGMQDMGAAGIICSTAEMSAKGGVGMRIDLDKVPTRMGNSTASGGGRGEAMKAWELLLSESQERMLLVAQKGREEEVIAVFEKWDLPAAVIGEVTDNGLLDFYMNGQMEASVPADELVLGGGAPQYDRETRVPAYLEKIKAFDAAAVKEPEDLKAVAEQIVALPSIASKRWIYNQYDSMVGTVNTSTNAPSDAAVVTIKGTKKGLGVTTDCNSRYVYADPYKGAMIAVSEAARNLVCSGAQPLGVTNCLNFGNPYDPEVYWQFVNAIKGMGDACRKFDTPVTGGNVSFYNQNPDGPVNPTPTIGMVGLLEDINNKMTLDFKNEGAVIYVLGKQPEDLGCSEYLYHIHGITHSAAPYFELEEEFALQQSLAELISNRVISSAHDVSEGGLLVTLLESGFNRDLGFAITTNASLRKDAALFGEAQSRVVVSVAAEKAAELEQQAGVPFEKIGTVTSGAIIINGENWGSIADWKLSYDTAIEQYLSRETAVEAMGGL
ncbi:phosphoribosylformylglycinamidine synthase II [Niabella ginsenosidivorans]|uniref:Phosphoribosylformylglycinamidine synthase subunit PurL n=1 Tax=Niabella ginsenosidivorans TaxID=1176587 RepID=A0A1A9HXX5_9BACT|nr:phosphoribosylformylglycinamidine synthase subunit PurL [Niabella ginsenosidivorans]ANH80103.1 phosphoribosylformylglycinamidine synthase II [Niabella ginsenosidivorans]